LNSYNFFADVRDQRIVAPWHSTLLGAAVSLAVAIALSGILYRFRDSMLLDASLSYLLVSDAAKTTAVTLIWNPLWFIGVVALLVFLLLLLLALIVRLLRAFVRAQIYAYHAYTVTMWSTAPLLLLVPVGMVLYRVLDSSLYVIPAFVLIAVLCAWVFLRLLKGMSIIMDVLPLKVYCAGLLSVAAVCALAYAYYDYTQSAPMYLSFLYSTLVDTQ
jgi:asparagine N-glycosylation enzyme membrane subunit Stt3